MADTFIPTTFELILNLPEDNGITETAQNNRALLQKVYRDQLAGDSEALIRLLDPEVVFLEAEGLPYGGTAKGVANVREGVAGMFSAWSHLRAEFLEFLAGGDIVIAYMMLTGTSRATGKVYEGPTAEMFRFKNGKIIEWRPIYWDTHAVRVACGLA